MPRHKFTGPGPGRPKWTEEQKRIAAEERARSYDFKAHLRLLLPLQLAKIQQIVEAKRKNKGEDVDLRVAEFLADRLHGRPTQAITGLDGGPLEISFTQILSRINGSTSERLPDRSAVGGSSYDPPVIVETVKPAHTPGNGNGNGNGYHHGENGHGKI